MKIDKIKKKIAQIINKITSDQINTFLYVLFCSIGAIGYLKIFLDHGFKYLVFCLIAFASVSCGNEFGKKIKKNPFKKVRDK